MVVICFIYKDLKEESPKNSENPVVERTVKTTKSPKIRGKGENSVDERSAKTTKSTKIKGNRKQTYTPVEPAVGLLTYCITVSVVDMYLLPETANILA